MYATDAAASPGTQHTGQPVTFLAETLNYRCTSRCYVLVEKGCKQAFHRDQKGLATAEPYRENEGVKDGIESAIY